MVLSVDIGSSALKAALIDSSGIIAGPYRYQLPDLCDDPDSPFPEVWYQVFCEAAASFYDYIDSIEAISISGHGPTLVPLGKEGLSIGGIVPWNHKDSRSFYNGSYFLPKVLWLRDHRPSGFFNLEKILFCPEYLAYRLCGEALMALPNERFIPYFWNKDLLDKAELDEDLFPVYVPLDKSWGELTSAISQETGLPAGIPVFCGGTDYLMALLGASCTVPGMCCNRTGSSEGINYCTSDPDAGEGLRKLPHFNPVYHHVSVVMDEAGSFLRSLSSDLSSSACIFELGTEFRGLLTGLMEQGTEFYQEHKEDVSLEIWFCLGCIRLALLFRDGVCQLEKAGCPVDKIRVTGGLAYLNELNQLKACFSGKVLEIPRIIDAELAGDAALALAGTGKFPSPEAAADQLCSLVDSVFPDVSLPETFLDLVDGF